MKKLVPYFTPDGRRVAPHGSVILSAVLAVVVVVLAAVSVRLYFTRAELLSQVEDLEAQLYRKDQDYANAQADYTEAQAQIDSMYAVLERDADAIEYLSDQASVAMIIARIVPNDGSNIYHRINCPYVTGEKIITSTILSTSSAVALGYYPCPLCESITSSSFQTYCDNNNAVSDLIDLIRHKNNLEWDIAALR